MIDENLEKSNLKLVINTISYLNILIILYIMFYNYNRIILNFII